MPAVAWFTLVAATLIVALTAVALLRAIVHLTHVGRTLDTLIGGVESIADRTSTVPSRLTSVNATLEPVRDWSETV
jgi:hypothetical protein